MVSAGVHPAFSVAAAAAGAGEEPALLAPGRRLTWAGLAEEVERERRRLGRAGALDSVQEPPGGSGLASRRVAFDAPPTTETVVRLLALFEAGACAAPLHSRLSPGARKSRLRGLAPCFDLDASAAVEPPEGARGLRWSVRPAGPGIPAPGSDGAPDAAPLVVLFTSGSSGAPRAVELSRGAFRASAAASAARLGWEREDRWLCCLPLAHVGGLSIITRCLQARRTVVLAGGFEAADVLVLLERESVTLASFVPTMLHRLFEVDSGLPAPPSLRAALVGGAPPSEELWHDAARRGFPALATYGMTETCSQVATALPGSPRRLVPLDGVRLRIADGRIEVGGSILCSRIGEDAADPSGTAGRAAAWTPDGWLRTGDLGEWRDGCLEVLGRADETIITGGENVVPAEVEAVLAAHPAIRRAVVFPVPDAEWGEIIAAALEPLPGVARPGGAELASWLDGRLASFQRPRRVTWLAALPETPAGKPDRAAVRAIPPDALESLREDDG